MEHVQTGSNEVVYTHRRPHHYVIPYDLDALEGVDDGCPAAIHWS